MKRWKPIIILTCASLALGGCGQVSHYQNVIHQATVDAKNLEAKTLAAAPCLIGLGAFFRLTDPRQKEGLVMLCGQGQEMPTLE